MRILLVTLPFLMLVIGCSSPDYLPEEELLTYVQEEGNGLSKSKSVGNLRVKVFCRPNDFLIWQELEGEEPDTTTIKEVFDRYDDYLYFMMQLSVGERDALYGLSTNQADFNERLQTLSFRMNQFVKLTTSNQDTIPVADFYYSRMFGMSSSNDILFVFNKEKVNDAAWLSFNVKEFGFRTGNQSFRFERDKLNSIPKLEELKGYYDLLK